jgi:HD-GYP domain-containing protein (c-di-GMP phosphodiesterase class II)
MGKQSTKRLFFVFVAATLLVVTGTLVAIFAYRAQAERDQAERSAAYAVLDTVVPVLARTAGSLDADELASLSAEARSLLSDRIWTLRVWATNGEPLAAVGETEAAPVDRVAIRRAERGGLTFEKRSAGRGDTLVSYAALVPGAVLEVQQSYAPIASAISAGRDRLLIELFVAGAGLAFVIPTVLWTAMHGLRSEYARLRYLFRTGQAIRSTLDVAGVLEQLTRDAALFTRAQLAIATLIDERGKELIVTASYDHQADSSAHHHRRVEEWYLRRCAATGETVAGRETSVDYAALLGYEPKISGAVRLVCAAIPGRERTTGVITVIRQDARGTFKPSEIQMVEELAAQAAMAVEQSVLFEKLRNYAQEVEAGYDSTLKVLSAALDTKDQDTHGHSERVARLTVAVARELGVPNERLVDIERGALLHDVGKIGVPDDVLRKPAALNEGEWEAMQKHPLLAGLMVSKVGFLEKALPILLYHHERFDGGGYPFGLQGHSIPLEARMFAVVDAFDAITSDRPYRKAVSTEAALAEIVRHAGTQFDPEIVEAFVHVIRRMRPADEDAA